MAEKHYEQGKKRVSLGLDTYHPCENKCKRDEKGIFKCKVNDYYKKIQKCQPYENSDAMKLEFANLENLKELWNVFVQLITESPIRLPKRSVAILISLFSLIGTGISSLMTALNTNQISNLNKQATLHTANDQIVSKSLRTIYRFQNETSNNIEKIAEVSQELVLAQTKIERKIQMMDVDSHRMAHVETNFRLISGGIRTITRILESALHGKLSSQITLIYDIDASFQMFKTQARKHGYIMPITAVSQLFQLETSYYVDKEANSINLLVHIPLLRDEKTLVMYKYVGTSIPISKDHGMILENDEDIIAYNDEEFVTLKSEDLWKCEKIATVHFCRDIISSVKPKSRMEETCLGALKAKQYDELPEKCQNIKIANLKNDVKRISASTFVIYSMEPSTVEIICLSKKNPDKREARSLPIQGFMKVSIDQNCIGNFNGETLYADTSFESDNNIASYWLPMENDLLKKYPGIDEGKFLNFLEKLPKITRPEYIGDLLKNADEIDHNNKMASQLAAQANTNIILWSLGSSALILVVTFIIYQCVMNIRYGRNSYQNDRITRNES